jgi:5-methylthioadenosine/S-adenosylhomocysteine deaminase
VRDVLVAGQVVVRDGRCTTIDEAELHAEAAQRVESLHRRAGISVPHRWPLLPSA